MLDASSNIDTVNGARDSAMKMKYLASLVGVIALFASAQASATLINFENAPSKGLTDNDAVISQYASEGVTFSGAFLEKTGGKDTNPQGFLNDVTGKYDDPAHGYAPATGATGPGSNGLGLGTWFLRSGGEIIDRGGPGTYLTVDYTTPVSAASGQIWDIDGSNAGSEQWNVVAYLNGTQVASSLSPKGTKHSAGTLNGKPWTFNLSSDGGFDQIQFWFTGTKTKNTGLAFDNFNTSALTVSVPEPSSVWFFGLGALGLMGLARRRTKRSAVDLVR